MIPTLMDLPDETTFAFLSLILLSLHLFYRSDLLSILVRKFACRFLRKIGL